MKIKFSVVLLIVLLFWVKVSVAAAITGPITVTAYTVSTYSYVSSYVVANPGWACLPGSGTAGIVQRSYQSGLTYYCDILWQQSGTRTLAFVENGSTQLGSLAVTTTGTSSTPVPSTTFTTSFGCGNTMVARNTTPTSSYEWYWQTSSTGAITTLTAGLSITLTTPTTLYLRARLKTSPFTWSATSLLAGNIGIYTTAPAAPSTSTNATGFQNSPVPLSVGSVSGATSYKWYTASSGGTAINGATANSYTTPSLTATTIYYVSALSGGCESTSRKAVTVTMVDIPQIQVAENLR